MKKRIATIVAVALYVSLLWAIAPKPAQAVVIGSWAYQNQGLTSVEIADDVTEIGTGAYANNKLRLVVIPDSVELIRNWAFEHNQLSVVVIEGDSTSFETYAFANNPGNLLIVGHEGSTAKSFAANRGFDFITLDRYQEADGIHIIYDNEGHGEIFYYDGDDRDIVIPDQLGGRTIVSIRPSVFKGLGLTSVTFPDSLETIGTQAFADNALMSVTFPDSVTEVGAWAFERNQLTNVGFGSGITQVADGVFSRNRLRTLILPETAVTVGAWAFERNELEYVFVGGPSTGLDGNALANQTGAFTIVGVEGSAAQAFAGVRGIPFLMMAGLEEENGFYYVDWGTSETSIVQYNGERGAVSVPGALGGLSVTEIWSDAFKDKGLTGVELPNGLERIGVSAFEYNALTSVSIPDSVSELGDWAFAHNRLESVGIGSGVSAIGSGAFSNNRIIFLGIPSNVLHISDWAFERNPIRELRLSEGVRIIGKGAFLGNALAKLRLPASVESVGEWAFLYTPLQTLIVEGDDVSFGTDPFKGSVDSEGGYTVVGLEGSTAEAFADTRGLDFFELRRNEDFLYINQAEDIARIVDYDGVGGGTLVVPDTLDGSAVRAIGPRAFAFQSLTGVTLPQQLTEIGFGAFQYNPIQRLILGNELRTIGNEAFLNTALSEVVIPEEVEAIGQWAFLYNPLTRVIVKGGTEIGNDAFRTLSEAAEVLFLAPQGSPAEAYAGVQGNMYRALETDGEFVFYEHKAGESTLYAYLGDGGNVEIPDELMGLDVTVIGAYAFSLKGVTAVTLPNSVTTIEEGAFQYNHLTEVSFGEELRKIGISAFLNNAISRVWIPASVERMGQWAFLYNPLQQVVFEGADTVIDAAAFVGSGGNAAGITLIGFAESTARAYAVADGFGFYDIETNPEVMFSLNGHEAWSRSLEISTVPNVQHGVLMHYIWSEHVEEPLWNEGDGWSEVSAGEGIELPTASGVWHLHLRVVDRIDRAYLFKSNPFHIDNDVPVISLESSPQTPTKQTVTVTADVYEEFSGIAALKWMNGDVDEDFFLSSGTEFDASFPVDHNGVYTVYAEDAAGNRALSQITIGNISRMLPTMDLAVSPDGLTNGNVTVSVSVEAANALDVRKYAYANAASEYFAENGTPWDGKPIVMSENGWLTLYVRDVAGNEAVKSIEITTIDRAKPVITLKGASVITIPIGASFEDPGAMAEDDVDGDLSGQVTVTGSVYSAEIGEYTLQYNVEDRAGNAAEPAVRKVHVVQPDKALALFPIMTPSAQTNGQVTVTASVYAANEIELMKYSFENVDLEYFTNEGTMWDGGPISVNENGWLSLYAKDSVGNEALETLRITNIDRVKPVIALNGAAMLTIEQWETFSDPGVSATDDRDGEITERVTVSGSINAAVVGEYTLRYDVADLAGNHADTVQRTVQVSGTSDPVETEAPPVLPEPVTPSQEAEQTATVIQQGGTIEVMGVIFQIPEQAIENVISIRVEVVQEDQVPLASRIRSEIFEITKDVPGKFAEKIRLTLPFEAEQEALEANGSRLTLAWLNEQTGEWVELERIGVNWETRTVSGETDHFTRFAVIELGVDNEPELPIDVAGHWAESYMLRLIRSQFASGYPDGFYRPDQAVTRAEFVTLVMRAMQLTPSGKHRFADMAGHWAEEFVSTASTHGFVNGYADGTFRPDAHISREEMAAILIRSFGLEAIPGGRTFADNEDISNWAKEAVQTAAGYGIVEGDRNERFRPGANATRAETAAVIVRLLNRIGLEGEGVNE